MRQKKCNYDIISLIELFKMVTVIIHTMSNTAFPISTFIGFGIYKIAFNLSVPFVYVRNLGLVFRSVFESFNFFYRFYLFLFIIIIFEYYNFIYHFYF